MSPPAGPPARPAGLRRVLGLLRPQWRWALIALVFGAAASALTVALPLVTRTIIDQGLAGRRPAVLAGQAGLLLGLMAALWVCTAVRRTAGGQAVLAVEFQLRNRLTRHLLALEPAWHDQAAAGQLLARAASDIGVIGTFITLAQAFSILNLLTLGLAATQMWLLSPRLALLALALAPLLIAAAIRFSRRLHQISREIQDRGGDLATVVEETAAGVRVVKACGREAHQQARLEREAGRIRAAGLRAARLGARYRPLIAALPQLSLAAVLWYGGRLVIEHQITIGTLIAFNSYLLILAGPITTGAMVFGITQKARASADRVFEVLDREPLVADRPGAYPLPAPAASGPPGLGVRVEKVSVRGGSGPGPARLDSVCLDICAGERIALTGPAGAGKSTLGALLPRLYQPDSGRILLDGHPLAGLRLDSVRAAVALVGQEPVLFAGTLRENLTLGRPQASEQEIRDALWAAAALDVPAGLPHGLDTVIGERGYTLSGGQRQRMAVGRALLSRPRLLILDDALCHLDAATEAAILIRLGQALGGTTVLLIGGRPATLRLADRVVSLEHGRIAAGDRGPSGDRAGPVPARHRGTGLTSGATR